MAARFVPLSHILCLGRNSGRIFPAVPSVERAPHFDGAAVRHVLPRPRNGAVHRQVFAVLFSVLVCHSEHCVLDNVPVDDGVVSAKAYCHS